MAGSGRRPGALAKVPRLSGGLRRDWHRSRAVGVNRDVPADAAGEPVRGGAVLPCGKTRAPLHCVAIPNDRNSTLKASERTIADMLVGADMSASSRRHLPSHPTAPAHYTPRKPPFSATDTRSRWSRPFGTILAFL